MLHHKKTFKVVGWNEKNSNGKLGTLTTFRDLVGRKVEAQNIFTLVNLFPLNSSDVTLKYYTELQKCFLDYQNIRM